CGVRSDFIALRFVVVDVVGSVAKLPENTNFRVPTIPSTIRPCPVTRGLMTAMPVATAMKLFARTQPPPQFIAEVEQERHMRVAFLFGRSLGHWKYGEPLSVRMERVCDSVGWGPGGSRGPLTRLAGGKHVAFGLVVHHHDVPTQNSKVQRPAVGEPHRICSAVFLAVNSLTNPLPGCVGSAESEHAGDFYGKLSSCARSGSWSLL